MINIFNDINIFFYMYNNYFSDLVSMCKIQKNSFKRDQKGSFIYLWKNENGPPLWKRSVETLSGLFDTDAMSRVYDQS